jgi:muramoyltetrapeptide carboxypeptidase
MEPGLAHETTPFLAPPALPEGARVSLISPAGPSSAERIESSIERCHQLGWVPVVGPAADQRSGYLAGPDDSRLGDLEWAIRDETVDAIWAIRGGYGLLRMIERINLGPLHDRPKAFIGFSDNTILHLAFARDGLVSFHGPHAGGAFPPFTGRVFQQILRDPGFAGALELPAGAMPVTLHGGVAEGVLAGGNLAILASACGTPWALRGRGRIIVIEDVNEPDYRIDRSLTQLRLAGCFDGAAAIAFGGFTWTDPERGATPLLETLLERTASLGIPVLAGLPFGHVDEQWTLPLGRRARIDAESGVVELLRD